MTLANNDKFQYIALIRYCQNTHATRKPLQQAYNEMQKKLSSMQDLESKNQAKLLGLQQENERLRYQMDQFEAMKAEVQRLQGLDEEVAELRGVNPKDLKTFLANKSAIRHYLKLVPMLME
jgi:DNA repair ATPase RecN